jgi:hypothetical protein
VSLDWPDLAKLIEAEAPGQVADALLAVDEPARRALAPHLKPYRDELVRDWQRRGAQTVALRVAGAGCLPKAADVVSWLRSPLLAWVPWQADPDPHRHVRRMLAAPGRPSPATVARGLAERMRPRDLGLWDLVAGLLVEHGVDPPDNVAFLRGWVRRAEADPARLATDPWLALLVPRLFDTDAIGAELARVIPALVELAGQGRVDRADLLAGCLRRLRVGDRPTAIGSFVELHGLLAPTLDEVAAHRQEYAGLLSSPHLPIATLAQAALQELDAAGRLPVATLADASRAVLLRPNKKLVRTQLTWLGRVAARQPDDTPRVLEALATGLGQESVDLAERTLAVIAAHLPRADAASRAALAEAAGAMTGDLGRQAAELLGVSALEAGPSTVTPVDLPVGGFTPVASLGELVAEVVAIAARGAQDPVQLERVLDGLVRYAASDRDGLVAAITPHTPQWDQPVARLLRAAARLPEPPPPAYHYHHTTEPLPVEVFVDGRLAELTGQLAGRPPVALLATPATADGYTDPERVLALLSAAEQHGRQPGPYDLTQTLLRLPRTVDPSVHSGASGLRSPAGRRFAAYLDRGGLADPEVTAIGVRTRCCDGREYVKGRFRCGACGRVNARFTVALHAPDPDLPELPPGLLNLPDGHPARQRVFGRYWPPQMALWPGVLPGHREILAGHIQPCLVAVGDGDLHGYTDVLPALARCGGPFGPASALAFGYTLGTARERDRLPVVDALTTLAARGLLDGDLLGGWLGHLVAGDVLILRRVVAGLTELARAGAHGAVWAAARAMLPPLLRPAEARPGTPDLLALASAAVEVSGERTPVSELAEVAARGGSSRLVTEARRLVRTLG